MPGCWLYLPSALVGVAVVACRSCRVERTASSTHAMCMLRRPQRTRPGPPATGAQALQHPWIRESVDRENVPRAHAKTGNAGPKSRPEHERASRRPSQCEDPESPRSVGALSDAVQAILSPDASFTDSVTSTDSEHATAGADRSSHPCMAALTGGRVRRRRSLLGPRVPEEFRESIGGELDGRAHSWRTRMSHIFAPRKASLPLITPISHRIRAPKGPPHRPTASARL